MVVAGLAELLGGWERLVTQALVLVAMFALSFAAQRSSGMVSRLTRPPARPLGVWVVFIAVVLGGAYLTTVTARAGQAPLGFFALAALIVTLGPRVNALWRRVERAGRPGLILRSRRPIGLRVCALLGRVRYAPRPCPQDDLR